MNSTDFDPDAPGQQNGRLFGLQVDPADAEVVIVPVPWDVTVSYADGTADGPEAILKASLQLDLEDDYLPEAWTYSMALTEVQSYWRDRSQDWRKKCRKYIKWLEKGSDAEKKAEMHALRDEINEKCAFLHQWVYQEARSWLERGKVVGVLGGEHSVPLGLLMALSERYAEEGGFGILQIDAHFDLRDAYEGLTYSHASIMHNALQLPGVKRLVQVGIRDYSAAEKLRASTDPRIVVFFDHELKRDEYEGTLWKITCKRIIDALPARVYVSYDIDGLNSVYCPHTGTPVPGGLEFRAVHYLLAELHSSGRTIIGFDLCEVSPGERTDWDANVGARVLYRLGILAASSARKA
ncbi:MAG: agmatinase family protein [Sphingomonadales bacterium]|nr:agmatinase family protein [Sphingomonadales bacterium]